MSWVNKYLELENLVSSQDGRLELVLTSERTYYVRISVFGEFEKTVITKDYSEKITALDVALTKFKKVI